MIYFDNSATTQTDPAVARIVMHYMTELYANPSSIHVAGQTVRKDLADARKKTASIINAHPKELVYTASGTEANNTALIQAARLMKNRGNHIITSGTEHKAVLNTCHFLETEGFHVTYLPVSSSGNVSVEAVQAALRSDTILVSLMLANNETGILSPIADIAPLLRPENILFHTDAVQALGKIPVDVDALGVDMLSFSGHKIHAPKGVGVLFVCEELREQLSPLIHGGGQEAGLRSGTENIPSVMGLATACDLLAGHEQSIEKLRDSFEKAVLADIPGTSVNGDRQARIGSVSSITFEGIKAEMLVSHALEVSFSLGSACTTGSDAPSHVLTAMGLSPEKARATARFSFSRFNTEQEVSEAVGMIRDAVRKLRH